MGFNLWNRSAEPKGGKTTKCETQVLLVVCFSFWTTDNYYKKILIVVHK